MIRRADFTWADANGTPEPGVYITVKTATGALATLFNDNGTSLSNPFQSGTLGAFVYNVTTEGVYTEEYRLSLSDGPRKVLEIDLSLSGLDGLFVNASSLIVPVGTDMVSTTGYSTLGVGSANYIYDATVDAAYVTANPRSSFISANSRGFRLDREQDFHVNMFGAVGDYNGTSGTDNAAAFAAAMVCLQALAKPIPEIGSLWFLGRSLSLKDGGRYYTTAPFSIISSLEAVDMTGAEIIIPANSHGIIDNADNTNGDSSRTSGPFPYLLKLINPKVRGHNGTDLTKHGIWLLRTAFIFNPQVVGISGDGIRIGQQHGEARNVEANQNGWFVGNPVVSNCGGSGIIADNGVDDNAGVCLNYSVDSCGRWGVEDASRIGNKWTGQSSNCGLVLAGVNTVPAFCVSGGYFWAIVVGQEANTTVTPSLSRPDVWIRLGTGSVSSAVPAWTSGMVMKAGGDICSVNSAGAPQFDHTYEEGGIGVAQISILTIVNNPNAPGVVRGGNVIVADIDGAVQTWSGWRANNYTDDTHTTKSVSQIGGIGAGGVNTFTHWIDTLTHAWKWECPGFLRLWDEQTGQGVINVSAPGAGINFGRSTEQSGVLFSQAFALGYSNSGRIVDMNTAAPTTGYHAQGEITFNSGVTAAGIAGWITAASGTPGTQVADYVNARAEPLTGIGYVTGAGGTVTQATSRTTGVTLNKVCGSITLFSAAGSATYQTFTVTNSAVVATDSIRVVQKSGTDKYMIHITAVGAGVFDVTFATTGGTTTEQPVFNFAVLKAVAA